MATTITANGINFPDGSAGSPSIGGTDTNTGLFTGSDIVGFATGGSERLRIDASGNINIANDSGKLQLGTSADLQIYHDGSHSRIVDNGTGRLSIQSNDFRIENVASSELMAKFVEDGQVELYYDNSKKFETYQYGVNFSGTAKLESGGNFHAHDNVKFIAGTGEDLQIYHDGNNSQIQATGGQSLFIKNDYEIQFLTASNEKQLVSKANGAVELYYDNTSRIETTTYGGYINGSFHISTTQGNINGIKQVIYGGATVYQNSGTGTGSSQGFYIGNGTSGTTSYVWNYEDADIEIATNGTARWKVLSGGALMPAANNTYDLGTSSSRVRNIYTNDLNLSNEGGSNDVDSTWGSYTIQEGAEDLFLINRRNGKKYKFNLTEVS